MIIITIKSKSGDYDKYEQFFTRDIEAVRDRIKELKEMGISKEDIEITGYNFNSSGSRQNLNRP